MPGAGVGLVEDFDGGHAHADGEVRGEGFDGCGGGGLGGGDVCAVAWGGGGAWFGDEEGGAVGYGWEEVLVAGGSCDGLWLVFWTGLHWTALTDPAGKHVAFHEGLFELSHANSFLVHHVFGRSPREEPRKAVVEIDQILRYTPAFGLVGFEDCAVGGAVDYGAEYPSEVVGVLHAYVHALAGFWTGDGQLVGGVGVHHVALACECARRRLPEISVRARRTCRLHAVQSGMLSTSHSTYR